MSNGFSEFTRAAVVPQYAWTRPEGGMANVMLHKGDRVMSFRGEAWIYEGVSQHAVGNSEGRVSVSRTCPDAYTTSNGQQDCPHMWHRNGEERQDYYPSVFSLYLGTADGSKA